MKISRLVREWSLAAALVMFGVTAQGQPVLHWIPACQCYRQSPLAISADGSTAVGEIETGNITNHAILPFRWTAALGWQYLSIGGQGSARDVNADGSMVVGTGPGGAFIWRLTNPATGAGVTTVMNPPGATFSACQGISADESALVFDGYPRTYRWTEATGFTMLPIPPGFNTTMAHEISADGSVIVGGAGPGSVAYVAFRWFLTDPQTGQGVMTTLGTLPGHTISQATGVSADGSVVVGMCYPDIFSSSSGIPFRWTLTNTKTGAGTMTAIPTGTLSNVFVAAVSGSGNVLVGRVSYDAAVVWTPQDGWRRLDSALLHQYGVPSWYLRGAVDVSPDGRAILGFGSGPGTILGPSTNWVARLPSAPCYADCNADGVLTVADFGCFQTRYVSASPYADCDADGAATINDFACFQAKFPLGCP